MGWNGLNGAGTERNEFHWVRMSFCGFLWVVQGCKWVFTRLK